MALRPGRTIRRIRRAYTRVSYSVPRKSYIKGVPSPRIVHFEMGNREGNFNRIVYLISKSDAQIRHNALEAARVVCNTFLMKKLGIANFFFKILKYPHQVIREKPIATGAGADRYSQGMRLAFGKPKGLALQAFKGEKIAMVKVNEENVEIAKEALRKFGSKVPIKIQIEVEEV